MTHECHMTHTTRTPPIQQSATGSTQHLTNTKPVAKEQKNTRQISRQPPGKGLTKCSKLLCCFESFQIQGRDGTTASPAQTLVFPARQRPSGPCLFCIFFHLRYKQTARGQSSPKRLGTLIVFQSPAMTSPAGGSDLNRAQPVGQGNNVCPVETTQNPAACQTDQRDCPRHPLNLRKACVDDTAKCRENETYGESDRIPASKPRSQPTTP